MWAVKAENLTKNFKALRAVNKVSFEIQQGEIFGLLGPNGAGKTTTIRMLTGIFKPTSGTAHIGKYDIREEATAAQQLMGIVPETANAYLDLSAWKNLQLMGELYGLEKKRKIKKAESLLRLFELYGKKDQKVKTFSKGMQQRLIVAMALMNDAKILFLDEPTSGLDVESVRLIRDLVGRMNDQGTTIFLTTHNIEEASQLCDRVAIMNHGKIVALDRPEKLKDLFRGTASIEVAFERPIGGPEELKFRGVVEIKKVGDKFRLFTESPADLIPLVVEYAHISGNELISLNTLGPSLEDVFVKLTSKENK